MGHAFHECPKRRRACVREFSDEAMATARAELFRRRAACEHKLSVMENLSGAMQVVSSVVV